MYLGVRSLESICLKKAVEKVVFLIGPSSRVVFPRLLC